MGAGDGGGRGPVAGQSGGTPGAGGTPGEGVGVGLAESAPLQMDTEAPDPWEEEGPAPSLPRNSWSLLAPHAADGPRVRGPAAFTRGEPPLRPHPTPAET